MLNSNFEGVFYDDFYGAKWETSIGSVREITWSIEDTQLILPSGEYVAATASLVEYTNVFQEAFLIWDNEIDQIMFVESNDGNSADITLSATTLDEVWGYWDYDWDGNKNITKATIIFDADILDSGWLMTTAMHEIGNILGLGDIQPSNAIRSVQEDPFPEKFTESELWQDDKDLLNYIYAEDDNITVLTGGGQQMKGDQFLAIADTFSGTNKDDRLLGYGGPDSLTGDDGNDFIHGHWGRDNITGGLGNDELRGGDGGDTIYGGNGADVIWGGGHKNTLDAGINDSSVDQIFIHADASLYDLPRDGSYADSLVAIGYEDQIFIHGVDDSALSFGVASMPNDPSQTGIGIYANGVLEATVGGDFTADQVNAMTTGGFFA